MKKIDRPKSHLILWPTGNDNQPACVTGMDGVVGSQPMQAGLNVKQRRKNAVHCLRERRVKTMRPLHGVVSIVPEIPGTALCSGERPPFIPLPLQTNHCHHSFAMFFFLQSG